MIMLRLWRQRQHTSFHSLQGEVSPVARPARFRGMFEEALRAPYSFLNIDFHKFTDAPEQAVKVRFERALHIKHI